MDVEEKINDCKFNLNQIIHFNPDPYYVTYFLKKYLQGVIDVYDGILEEANRDFGLFVSGRCTIEKLEFKAGQKNDQTALKFISWYNENYKVENRGPYPNFIAKMISIVKQNDSFPKILVKMTAKQGYKGDHFQEIKVNLSNGKLIVKELEIQIKRQIPVFLEIINQKRKDHDEPKVYENQVIASAFVDMRDFEDIEVLQACTVYLSVMQRFWDDSREEINRLTSRS
jgi:hypothetical protein